MRRFEGGSNPLRIQRYRAEKDERVVVVAGLGLLIDDGDGVTHVEAHAE